MDVQLYDKEDISYDFDVKELLIRDQCVAEIVGDNDNIRYKINKIKLYVEQLLKNHDKVWISLESIPLKIFIKDNEELTDIFEFDTK